MDRWSEGASSSTGASSFVGIGCILPYSVEDWGSVTFGLYLLTSFPAYSLYFL